jgi:flagellar motor switch/type III secretory pathway protein FliN
MNGLVKPWLPPPAAGDVERALDAFVAEWAGLWLVAPGPRETRASADRTDKSLDWFGRPGARVGLAPACRRRLGLALVVSQAEIDHLPDQVVLGRLADAAVRDLGSRLSALCAAETDGAPTLFCLSSGANGWSLWFEFGEDIRIALRLRAAGSKTPPKLTSLSEAIAPQMVRLGCRIGSATISAGDLAGLSTGDLIELDHRITDSLKLTIAGHSSLSGKAKIIEENASPAVQIVEKLILQ